MLAFHTDALRADFQRYYGLSLDDMGEAYTYRHASALCAWLPDDSAVYRAEGDGWSRTQRMLAQIGRSIDVVWWQRTEDGHRANAVPPDNYEPPRAAEERMRIQSKPIGERMRRIAEAYGYEEVLDG